MKCMDQLERECHSFTRYLTGFSPSPYMVGKYRGWHEKPGAAAALKSDSFDQYLVEAASRGPGWARLADSYASRFRKCSALRKKLVLVLAILECVPPACEALDAVDRGGAAGAILRMSWAGTVYAGCVLASLAVFTPARMRLARLGRSGPAVVLER
jgi:hypothetical protein